MDDGSTKSDTGAPPSAAGGAILLAEDSRDDEEFFRRALQKTGFLNPVHSVHSGDEAIKYLRGDGQYAHRAKFPLPHLLVLDLNMPGKGGWEVLRWVRQQPEISALLVIILGGSGSPAEEEMAQRLGATGYHPKPATPAELEQFAAQIGRAWLLPPAGKSEIRNPTRCDGATARREAEGNPKSEIQNKPFDH